MISLKISDIKHFMAAILVGDTFDNFLVSDVNISTYCDFNINGHINHAFYIDDDSSKPVNASLVPWKKLKPICYDLIKGKNLPLKFKIIFFLSDTAIEKILSNVQTSLASENINGLCINIKYENNILTCTTGTSLNIFTMDKSLENYFDNSIKTLFANNFKAEEL